MTQPMTEEQFLEAMEDPAALLHRLDELDASTSLRGFITYMWDVLEPGRKFVTGWAVDAICEHLEAVSRGEIKRLLMNVPPGCMKSLTTNVFWPAYEWGPLRRPWLRYVGASYSNDLTIRDNLRCRNLIMSPRYQRLWGTQLKLELTQQQDQARVSALNDPLRPDHQNDRVKWVEFVDDQNAKKKFANTASGFKIATSVTGLGTGERGDRFVIDDPHNVLEAESDAKREEALQWFTEVVPTRINDESSAIVVIMQRVHQNDVSGLILAKELGYTHLCLPMEYEPDHTHRWPRDPRTFFGQLLWPERFSQAGVEELKKTLRAWGGSYAEAGQLQQRPAPRGGGLFITDRIRMRPTRPQGPARRVRGWDLANSTRKKSPWTVGWRWAELPSGELVIEDVVRFKATPGEVEERILRTATQDGRQVLQDLPQDPGQAGKAQKLAFARLLKRFRFRCSPETGSKVDRALPMAAQFEAGNVSMVEGHWNQELRTELEQFPMGTYSDQVDAGSRGYHALLRRGSSNTGAYAPGECFTNTYHPDGD